jgi:hypothetical protein
MNLVLNASTPMKVKSVAAPDHGGDHCRLAFP